MGHTNDEDFASWQRAQAAIALAAEADERLAERAERRRADGTDIEERHQERQRAAAAAQQQPPLPRRPAAAPAPPARDWPSERRWIEGIVDGKISRFGGALGEEIAGLLAKERAALEDRIAKSEQAVTELLMEMERRLLALESRAAPQKPRLIAGGSDAA